MTSLLRAYLFADLSPAELTSTAYRSTTVHVRRGEVVFSVGDHADDLYVVVDGQLKERLIQPDGAESVFELYTSGGVFGEPGLFVPERTRIVDMVATETSHVVRVPRTELMALMQRSPHVSLRLIEGLASDVRALGVQQGNAVHLSVKERVASKLLELAETHGRPEGPYRRLELALTQSLLATMVGTTRENVNRALAELGASGACRLDVGHYVVEPALLRQAAHANAALPRRNRLSP